MDGRGHDMGAKLARGAGVTRVKSRATFARGKKPGSLHMMPATVRGIRKIQVSRHMWFARTEVSACAVCARNTSKALKRLPELRDSVCDQKERQKGDRRNHEGGKETWPHLSVDEFWTGREASMSLGASYLPLLMQASRYIVVSIAKSEGVVFVTPVPTSLAMLPWILQPGKLEGFFWCKTPMALFPPCGNRKIWVARLGEMRA